MVPLEMDRKTEWPYQKAQLKLAEIRGAAIAAMREQDAEHGIGPDGKVYDEIIDDSGRKAAVIDPVKARFRHSGEDTIVRIQDEWYRFCSEPQDSSLIQAPIRRPERKKKILAQPIGFPIADDSGGADNYSDGLTSAIAPPVRRRGRPPKNRLAEV